MPNPTGRRQRSVQWVTQNFSPPVQATHGAETRLPCQSVIYIFLVMETPDPLRHQFIGSLMGQHPEGADAAIVLWEKLATEVISIVGAGGFDSLYARSVFLAQSRFPWLAAGPSPAQAGDRFASLKTSLAAQTPAHASEANRLLLVTFTDIVASLIGETLTTGILRSAWGNAAADKNGKELKK